MTAQPPQPDAPASGILPFAADCMARRVNAEGILLAGGGRALLLQIAHPAVAKGVAEHSGYRTDRWRRLLRTLRPMYAIVFGSRDQAQHAVDSVNEVHERVAGAGYSARDPDLLLWVLATLIETSFDTYERFVGQLTREEQEAYYRDMCRVGVLLNIPRAHLPPDVDAFRAYFSRTLASLTVSDTARRIARDLIRTTPLSWPFLAPATWVTAGLLPPALRDQYGLGWGPKREATLRALQRLSRLVVPLLPRPVRRPPWFLMPRDTKPP